MDPQSLTYRSPVYRELRNLEAEFVEINGYAVATSIGDASTQASTARNLALCDLSGLPRMGVKGRQTGKWLTTQGLSVPTEPNRALQQDDGLLLAMLADNEGLVLGDMEQRGRNVERLTRALQDTEEPSEPPTRILVPRQHGQAWFRVTGREMAAAMAKLCAVDLRPAYFHNLQVAQTSVARLNTIVIRDDLIDIPAVHLLSDVASAGYLWECILDAGAEHDMRVIGLDALLALNRG
jgi:sarcosine oxidase subunit gamma